MKLPAGITNRGLFIVGALAGVAGVIVMLARRTTAAPVINVQPAAAPVTDSSTADLIGAMQQLTEQLSTASTTGTTATTEATGTPAPATGPIYANSLHTATALTGAGCWGPGNPGTWLSVPGGTQLPVVQAQLDGALWWVCEQGKYLGCTIPYHDAHWSVAP